MGNWSKLKADEKVRVIKFARLNGVSDIKTIMDTYNLYSNGGNLAHKYDGTTEDSQFVAVDAEAPKWDYSPNGPHWGLEGVSGMNGKRYLHYPKKLNFYVNEDGTVRAYGYESLPIVNRYGTDYIEIPVTGKDSTSTWRTNSWGDTHTVLNFHRIPVGKTTQYTPPPPPPIPQDTTITVVPPPVPIDTIIPTPVPPPAPVDTVIPTPKPEPVPKPIVKPTPKPKPKPEPEPQPSEEMKKLLGNIPSSGLEKDNTNIYTREAIQPIYMEGSAPVQNNLLTFDNVEDFMSYYGLAKGGNLSHKKSTGGPLYPFSFEKNLFLKTPVVRYDEGGFFARLFGKKDTSPTPEKIKADRVERFINDTWETEYSVPKGYDPKTGLFYPYKSPEGGTKTIGPGFKLRKDGSGDATMFSAKEAAKGVTREQINEKLRAQGELQYDKVLEFLNQKGNKLPVDTINPNIMNGLMDLRFLVGSLGGWDNLREAVLNGDLEGIKKESLVTFKDGNTGKIKPDVRRNDLRTEKFWHYD